MISVENLSYEYVAGKNKFKLENINFSLGEGYIMALLGSNGAGKTTLLKNIYGLLIPSEGDVRYDGKSVKAKAAFQSDYHQKVAYVGDEPWLFIDESVKNSIEILKLLYPDFDDNRWQKLLELFEIEAEKLDQIYEELSKGQQMLVQIAFALARKPKLLIMDEPLANLDPVIKTDIVEILQQSVRYDEMSVIMSTHLIEEINDVVDYVGVMKAGKMVQFGDREELFSKNNADTIRQLVKME